MKATDYATALTEAQFQQKVIDRAQANGWMVAHFRPARTEKGWRTPVQGDPGFPDLVLARAGRVIVAELKSESGRVSKPQWEWIDELTAHGDEGCDPSHEVYVWRPSLWSGICEVLE